MRSAFLSLLLASIASAAPQMSAPVRTGTIPNAPRSASEDQPAAAIASAGNSILTAWNTGDATFVARLYPWLTADPTSIQKFALQPGHEIGGYPQIATDGSEYLVAWSELSRERTSFDVVLARFDLDGRLIEGPSIVERDATEPARLMWVNPTYQVAVPAAILIVPQHSIVIAHRAYMRPANVGVCGSDIVSARVYVTPKLCFPYSCPSPSLTAEIYWLNTGVTWTSLLLTGAFTMPITPEYACTTRAMHDPFPL